MKLAAEFEEKSYEAPLYNQLERGQRDIFTPGQVLEGQLGFDRGLFLTQAALWETLGYDSPLCGAALAYYRWPPWWKPPEHRRKLPPFRLNLFLQAKRPIYYDRKPRRLKGIKTMRAPLWAFEITEHQQRLLKSLSDKTRGRAHVAYAAAAFHTNQALFTYTRCRTIVEHSTFPSVDVLAGHYAWYYQGPGAQGAVNPNPESIEEPPLIPRIRALAHEAESQPPGNLAWLDTLAENVIGAVGATEGTGAVDAQFFDDLQTLDRLTEGYSVHPSLRAYAQVALFAIRFDLNWLVIGEA